MACKGKSKSTSSVSAASKTKEEEGEVGTISSAAFCSMGICQVKSKGRDQGVV